MHARVETFTSVRDTAIMKHFVICFDTPEHARLSAAAEETLSELSFAQRRFERTLDEERIQKFVNRDALYLNLDEPLHSVIPEEPGEPLWSLCQDEPLPQAIGGDSADDLLHLLSIAAAGSRSQVQKIFSVLGIERPVPILRNLRLLGHIELGRLGTRWSVVPPTLYEKGTNSQRHWAIAGQRSPDMLAHLELIGANAQAQAGRYVPRSITVPLQRDSLTVGQPVVLGDIEFLFAGDAARRLSGRLAADRGLGNRVAYAGL